MPKSKRSRVVTLTQTRKKPGYNLKRVMVDKVREALDRHRFVYVFGARNMRNASFKDVRSEWEGSRFFMGKNKVMQHALGRSKEEEYKDGILGISKLIVGTRGLLFTDSSPEDVLSYFGRFEVPHFARSGFKATHKFTLRKGIMEDTPFSLEPQLRKLGLKTKLASGKVELLVDTVVCQEGEVLTPEQCKLLELFEVTMAKFTFSIIAVWSEDDGFHEFTRDELTKHSLSFEHIDEKTPA